MDMMRVSQLSCGYGKNKILTDVSFTIQEGDMVALIGPNGCGKSTLLQILSGLKKKEKGEIYVAGNIATSRMLRQRIGYVPQSHFLAEECTVMDHLLLWYEDRKSLEKELEEGFLCELGIPQFIHRRCGQLSGGMKKKVSIACALSSNPEILLLDEPCAALDLASKQQLREYLEKYVYAGHDKKKAIIMATHEEIDMERCNKILEIKGERCSEYEK